MPVRSPAVAGTFYPSDGSSCRGLIDRCRDEAAAGRWRVAKADLAPPSPVGWLGGIVPHAGWVYSGTLAAAVFEAIAHPAGRPSASSAPAAATPRAIILFGAVHVWGVRKTAIYPAGAWHTPLGDAEIDTDLAREIAERLGDLADTSAQAHADEHSIEVQVPFVQTILPDVRIVPIMVPPGPDAARVGERLGDLLVDRPDIVAVGSTDLTHYGPRYGFTPKGVGPHSLRWVREENDRRMVDLILKGRAEDVVPEYQNNQNACGPGAIAAAVAAARTRGRASGRLLAYATSLDVRPERTAQDFVGYAGVVF